MTTIAQPLPSRAEAAPRTAAVPWVLVALALASTSIVVGLIWDISWHRSIGRDRFLTPAHLAIYLGGVVAGLASGWTVLRTTFGGDAQRKQEGVRFWGFTGPTGAWIAIWGSLAMVTSAPFDNWWHEAYGLDVKILSPPHVLLLFGMIAIQFGAMIQALTAQNRSGHPALPWLLAFTAGLVLVMLQDMVMAEAWAPNDQHGSGFYIVSAALYPFVLAAVGRAARLRYPATAAAAVYMGVLCAMIWILQLFPATPLLGPIYNPITRMVPPFFPLLLVVPALALDLLMRRVGPGKDWRLSLLLGLAFVGVLLAVQWPFAGFLLSPAARNGFFASGQWEYTMRPGPWLTEFWDAESGAVLLRGLAWAAVAGIVSSRIGLWWGNWMTRVRR